MLPERLTPARSVFSAPRPVVRFVIWVCWFVTVVCSAATFVSSVVTRADRSFSADAVTSTYGVRWFLQPSESASASVPLESCAQTVIVAGGAPSAVPASNSPAAVTTVAQIVPFLIPRSPCSG